MYSQLIWNPSIASIYRLTETDPQRRRRLVAESERISIARFGVCLLWVAGGDVAELNVVVMNRSKETEKQKEARREKDKLAARVDKYGFVYSCRERGRRWDSNYFICFFFNRLEELKRLEKDYLTSKDIDGHEKSKLTPVVLKQRVQHIVSEMGAQMGDRGNAIV
jgi:hypothetical protein